jgi:hypothetical protein
MAKVKAASVPAAPIVPLVIDPRSVFTVAQARQALGLTLSTIRREVRLDRLRVSKRAGKYFLLGEWILDWLRSGEIHRAEGQTHA